MTQPGTIAVSTLGFLSHSLLTMPRVYFAMAADGTGQHRLTITDERMSRFWITLPQAVESTGREALTEMRRLVGL